MKQAHGYAGKVKHPLYLVRMAMLERCYNKKHHDYNRYGGRGVIVCKQWINDPVAFIKWGLSHGWAPGLTIDRKNNDGPYSPGNCRFSTRLQQARNRSDNVLTAADVVWIRKLFNELAVPYGDRVWFDREVAAVFGVAHNTVRNVRLGRTWKQL